MRVKTSATVVAALVVAAAAASAQTTTLSELIKRTPSGDVRINMPVKMEKNLTLEADVSLTFRGKGRVVSQGRRKLTMKGPVYASGVQVFEGFEPGDIRLASGVITRALPQWWGASVSDGKDDSKALQCAVDSGVSTVFLPRGKHLINSTINATNRPFGLRIEGESMSESGSVLVGNTGGVVLDTTGSRYMDLRSFMIASGKETPSTIGVVFARSKKIKCAEFSSMTDFSVKLESIPEANDGNGTVAVYNYAAELFRGHSVYLWADNGIVFTGYNIFGVKSDFADIGAYPSMSCASITGSSTLRGVNGPAVTLDNAFRISIENAFFCGLGGDHKGRFAPYAVALRGPGYFQQNIKLTGHLEGKQSWLYNEIVVTGLEISGTSASPRPAAIVNYGSISNGKIDLKTWIDVQRKEAVLIQGKGQVSNMDILLGPKHTIDTPQAEFFGNTIRTWLTAKEARKRINVNPRTSSYILMAKDGIEIINPDAKAKVSHP